MAKRFVRCGLLLLLAWSGGVFAAETSAVPAGKVIGYYAESEFTTSTLGDEHWANFRQQMEATCPLAYQKPFVWRGPTTGFGIVKSVYYRSGNVVVSIKRFLATRSSNPWEMEALERVEYLRKEKRADGTDIIESTTKDATGKTLRHRFQPGPAPLAFITTDAKAGATALAQAQQMLGLAEVEKTTYLGFPAVRLASSRLQLERVELADDPQVPLELRHSVMTETRYGPKGEIAMVTRTLVLKPEETFDASILAAPTDVEEMPARR